MLGEKVGVHPMAIAATPSAQRVTLKHISWRTFETLLAEMGEDRGCRLTYDGGTLEIMTPLMPDEHHNRLLAYLIVILAEELNLPVKSVGSLTCKRQDLLKGVEPDSAFYIEHEPLVRNQRHIDLAVDPPPDLVIEVDYTRSSVDKLAIYAALGVPELWRYDEPGLLLYQLQAGQYVQRDRSPTFAQLPLTEIPRFLKASLQIGEIPMLRSFRAWVRQQLSSNEG